MRVFPVLIKKGRVSEKYRRKGKNRGWNISVPVGEEEGEKRRNTQLSIRILESLPYRSWPEEVTTGTSGCPRQKKENASEHQFAARMMGGR